MGSLLCIMPKYECKYTTILYDPMTSKTINNLQDLLIEINGYEPALLDIIKHLIFFSFWKLIFYAYLLI